MKTRDRIILAALELFNREGERNITTNHIAAHMGISPGNLYYHYRNKEDIILGILTRYVKQLDERYVPVPADQLDFRRIMNYLDGVFEAMWDHRFFYANLPDILSRDTKLQKIYLESQRQLLDFIEKIIMVCREKNIVELDNNQIVDLANNMKIVSAFWLSYQQTMAPKTRVSKQMVLQGVLQILSLVEPFATEEGKLLLTKVKTDYQAEKVAA